VNRIGDFAFLVGAFTLFVLTGTFSFEGMEAAIAGMDPGTALAAPLTGLTVGGALALAGLCLFGGATGKSAQIPLYVWLPDAMAGPTPVSALIHAATMVTAGIYLLGRMDFLYVLLPGVTQVVAVVAAATALLSGLIAIGQNDIKKVLAYSTVSQLGFMFCGMATTVWTTGLFHVVTHAFFKALLFLGAGAVIVAMHHEQDIRKMGGLWHDLRGVTILFVIGALALAGVPPFAGFYSKDAILAAVHLAGQAEGGAWRFVYWTLVVSAALTAFYTTRLVILTFFGRPHDAHRHLHPVHWSMTAVLVLLAGLSIVGGWAEGGIEHVTAHGWAESAWVQALDHETHEAAHTFAMICSLGAVLVGAGLGVVIYGVRPAGLGGFAEALAPARVALENKLYVDELYDIVIVRPLRAGTSLLFTVVDRALIDRFLVEGAGRIVGEAATAARATQVGAVSGATTAILAGAVGVLLWLVAFHG
jgi:NADH-quinone oxidoreductase subunit L